MMNGLVMYDHQTDTLWSQFLSQGVKGPLSGTNLEIVPSLLTTWGAWSQLHPETAILEKRGRYFTDQYERYYATTMAGKLGESNPDDRLSKKDLVIGLVSGKSAKAYPFRVIFREEVVNDYFAGKNVVVAFEPVSETGVIFDRTVNDRTLSFERLPPENDLWIMRDRETGTVWDRLQGRSIAGPLAGNTLKRLPSHYAFWFAWSDYHPNTALYGGGPSP